MKQRIIQIESLSGAELLKRLENVETAINRLILAAEEKEEPQAEYMSRKEVAAFFSVSVPTIHDWINKGVLTAYKAGNRTYFKRAEVAATMVKKQGKYA